MTTDQPTLRAMQPLDAAAMFIWENDPKVIAVSGHPAQGGYTIGQIESFIACCGSLDIYVQGQLRLIVEYMGEAVGTADLFDYDDRAKSAKIGILIYPVALRGCGLGSCALRLLLGFAAHDLGLVRLMAQCHATNLASLGLFRGCGFSEVGSVVGGGFVEFEILL